MQHDHVTRAARKNRRTGMVLALLVLVLFAYSFIIIRRRGQIPEPAHLTSAQKILRGL